jgi:hypothetical protein
MSNAPFGKSLLHITHVASLLGAQLARDLTCFDSSPQALKTVMLAFILQIECWGTGKMSNLTQATQLGSLKLVWRVRTPDSKDHIHCMFVLQRSLGLL